jgi:hypothetical protein
VPKRGKICAFVFAALILTVFLGYWRLSRTQGGQSAANTDTPSYETTAKRDLLALLLAYPDEIKDLIREKDNIFLIMKSGRKIIYDDKKQKSFEQKLAAADLQDMLEQLYPLSDINELNQGNFDPGRIRAYDFLKEVSGAAQKQISANLIGVPLGSTNLPFNKNNNAAGSLKAAFGEILKLVSSNPEIYSHIYPIGGTYNYRFIAGTGLLSPHAFGIAIDLKSDKYGYWRWATKAQGQGCLNSFPRELVRIFEQNHFIWGGKWAHFDIFHFEYRPELIIKAKYYAGDGEIEPWYLGFPDTDLVRSCIEKIERVFE